MILYNDCGDIMKKIRTAIIIFLLIFLARGYFNNRENISREVTLKDSENFVRREDLSDKIEIIKEKAKDDKNYAYVYENIDKLPDLMVKLAAKREESLGFIIGYLKDDKSIAMKSEDCGVDNPVKFYLQYDPRWGYVKYAGGIIGTRGCMPTTLSMTLSGCGIDRSPKEIAEFAEKSGYVESGMSSWNLVENYLSKEGINVHGIMKSEIISELENGNYVILSFGPGYFTDSGHIALASGLDDEGRIILNDPNSIYNSKNRWRYDRIKKQIKAAWAVNKDL